MKMKVAIVIPNWNGADLIAECLQSLAAQTYPADVIVVDNGSEDSSVAIIESKFPAVSVIKLAENTGFAGGVNAGIRQALEQDYDAIAVFNNDAVADKNWLGHLVERMAASKQLGIVGSKQLLSDKEHIDAVGNAYTIWGTAFPIGRNEVDSGQHDEAQIFSAAGGAMLCLSKMLRDIGLFDETFFLYYEDVDLGFRARLAGWDVVCEPNAVVYHGVSVSSEKLGSLRRYHTTKNFHLMFLKDMPALLFWKYLPLTTLQSFRLAAGSIVHGQFLTHVHGYFAAVRLIPHALRERRGIQKNRKVSSKEIDALLFHGRAPKFPLL